MMKLYSAPRIIGRCIPKIKTIQTHSTPPIAGKFLRKAHVLTPSRVNNGHHRCRLHARNVLVLEEKQSFPVSSLNTLVDWLFGHKGKFQLFLKFVFTWFEAWTILGRKTERKIRFDALGNTERQLEGNRPLLRVCACSWRSTVGGVCSCICTVLLYSFDMRSGMKKLLHH